MDLISEFFKHNTMMNRKLVETCRSLTPDQLGATVAGTYGTIGATLVHVANGQIGYASRFLGTDKPQPLAEDPFPGFDALEERFAQGHSLLEEAAGLADSDRQVVVSGDDPPGSWQMNGSLLMLQAINHGTEHRSQIATILTQIGVEPPEMDGWTYFFESGHMVVVDG